jgi:hypothetical protein
MRILICLAITTLLLCQKSEAATAPVPSASSHTVSDSGAKQMPLWKLVVSTPYKKMGFVRKLQVKLLQSRLKHFSTHAGDDTTPRKNHLSTISLILGLVALVAAFIPTAVGAISIIAAPAALVIGIIALGKRYRNDRASRSKAIIGIVLGSVLIFLMIIAVILIASGGFLLFI